MVFPTLNFLIFYLCVWPTSWLLVMGRRHQLHKVAIILASYIFYAAWSTDSRCCCSPASASTWWPAGGSARLPIRAGAS